MTFWASRSGVPQPNTCCGIDPGSLMISGSAAQSNLTRSERRAAGRSRMMLQRDDVERDAGDCRRVGCFRGQEIGQQDLEQPLGNLGEEGAERRRPAAP